MLEFLTGVVPQLLVTGLMIGALYALVALCFYIVHAGTGVINFAQGDFVVVGVVFTWLFVVDLALPLPLALLLTVCSTAAVLALFERLMIAPVIDQDPMIPLLVTLAGGILIRSVVQIVWGVRPRRVPHYSGDDPINLLNAAILPQAVWILLGTGVVLLLTYGFYKMTMFGLSLLAAASDREGARVIGVNTARIGLYCFGLSAAVSGAAGFLMAPITTADPQLGLELALKGFAGAILGGIDRPHSAVAGGLLIGLFEALIGGLFSSEYRNLFVFAILMLTMVVRPQGVFGKS